MAAALALVSVVLLSQIGLTAAVTSPWDVDIACGSYQNGCTCSGTGMVINTASAATGFTNFENDCCSHAAPQNCYGWALAAGGTCAADKKFDISKLTTPSGNTPNTTCCTQVGTVTCSQVSCTARRRYDAQKYKAKTGVASTPCTSRGHCEATCCELDSTMCMNAVGESCGAGKQTRVYETRTCSGGVSTTALQAVATATFSNGSYATTCCETSPPAPAPTPCPTSPSCPTSKEAHSNVATQTYMKHHGSTASQDEQEIEQSCCQNKATACISLCNAGGFSTQGQDSCGIGGYMVCPSATCTDANTVLDTTKVFQTGDNAAAKKTACCVPEEPSQTCAQKEAAAAADAAAAAAVGAGSTSAAHCKCASMAVAVLASFVVELTL